MPRKGINPDPETLETEPVRVQGLPGASTSSFGSKAQLDEEL